MKIELDNTSSGLQIAAALTKDNDSAVLANLYYSEGKKDIYKSVLKTFYKSAAFKSSGVSKSDFCRDDVKPAVIAKIYGGGEKPVNDALAAALPGCEDKALFEALNDAVNGTIPALPALFAHFEAVVAALDAAGYTAVTFTSAAGTVTTINFDEKETYKAYDSDKTKTFVLANSDIANTSYGSGIYYASEVDVSSTAKSLAATVIQGLDALLLMKTGLKLFAAGIDYLPKHDAYIIDAENAEFLKTSAAEAFYEIFSNDILGDFDAELAANYPNADLPVFETNGVFEIEAVKNANFMLA
jgi:DNA-directed RNA polymerase